MSFSNNTQITRPPQGVNLQYSSFSIANQNSTYTMPQYQPKGVHKQRRPGGGWDEESDEPQLQTEVLGSRNNNIINGATQQNAWKDPLSFTAGPSQAMELNKPSHDADEFEVTICDENFINKYEYENRIVNDLIQPGGARVKQPDATLSAFCNTCESIPPRVVGSLLLNKMSEEIPWISKARIIFGIEALSTKLSNYFDYFKHNIQVIKQVNFEHEGINAIQLRNLMNSLTHILEQPSFDASKQKENQIFSTQPSQTQNKPKPVMNPSKPAIAKAISSPVTSTTTPPFTLNINNDKQSPTQPISNFSRNPPTQQPLNPISNIEKPKEQPQVPPQRPAEVITPVINIQSAQESSAKLPLDQMNSLMHSLSDLDFSSDSISTRDNVLSPNNIHNLYNVPSPINYLGTSPMNYMGGYTHSPMYQNYPVHNYQMQGGFNAHYRQHEAGVNSNYNRPNGRHATYPGNNPHTPPQGQKFDQIDEMIKEIPDVDYDKEEREKEKEMERKRLENEKRFNSLNFKF